MLLKIQHLNHTIKYKPGPSNSNADFMSWIEVNAIKVTNTTDWALEQDKDDSN
jgi:hypothetical protein